MNRLHHLLHRTLARINIALQNTSLADFALRPPKDLRLLVALPRAALLLQEQHANGCIPVYLQCVHTNPIALSIFLSIPRNVL